MKNINEFIDSRNEAYTSEIFPKICEQTSLTDDVIGNNDTETFSNIIGHVSGKSCVAANYIVLKHLKAYHQWLVEHYELVPKK